MYLKIIFSFIILLFFKTNLLYALSQDISLTIMVRSTLGTEYILAKSICKVLDRELEISHSYGGSNTLECDTRLDDSVDEIIKKITRGNKLSEKSYVSLVENLAISEEDKAKLLKLSPIQYIGLASYLAKLK